jgi:hypothetical protein
MRESIGSCQPIYGMGYGGGPDAEKAVKYTPVYTAIPG